MVSDLSSYSPLLCCVVDTTSYIISIHRPGFLCFISYCPVCHTTTPKGSRSSCDGIGGYIPGSCSCHSGSSTAYSVGQGSHGCSSVGDCSSCHDLSGHSLICGTPQTLLRLTSTTSTSYLQTPLTSKVLPNDNRYAVNSGGFSSHYSNLTDLGGEQLSPSVHDPATLFRLWSSQQPHKTQQK
jgi:hypothetical protein